MRKFKLFVAAVLCSVAAAYAAPQKYCFLYEVGHEDQPATSWFILDREAKKFVPDACGDDDYTVKNYKKTGNTETFDVYDGPSLNQKVILKKNAKGQTIAQFIYGSDKGPEIVCGTEAEQEELWKKHGYSSERSSSSSSGNVVDNAAGKVKNGLKNGLGKLKKKK